MWIKYRGNDEERETSNTHIYIYIHHLGSFDFSGRASALAENFKLSLLDTFIRHPYFSWIFSRSIHLRRQEKKGFSTSVSTARYAFSFFRAGQKPRSSRIGTVFSPDAWKFLIAGKKKMELGVWNEFLRNDINVSIRSVEIIIGALWWRFGEGSIKIDT